METKAALPIVADSKEPRPAPAGKPPARNSSGRRRRSDSDAKAAPAERYFLAAADSNDGIPALDRELPGEADAIIESFRSGRNYYAVSEWSTSADKQGALPTIRKEPVIKTKNS